MFAGRLWPVGAFNNALGRLLGYAASAAVLATFCMSTMIPLRVLALASNVLFMAYGYVDHLYPVLILHALLFPVNTLRLVQFQRLVRDMREANRGGLFDSKPLALYDAAKSSPLVKRSCEKGKGQIGFIICGWRTRSRLISTRCSNRGR